MKTFTLIKGYPGSSPIGTSVIKHNDFYYKKSDLKKVINSFFVTDSDLEKLTQEGLNSLENFTINEIESFPEFWGSLNYKSDYNRTYVIRYSDNQRFNVGEYTEQGKIISIDTVGNDVCDVTTEVKNRQYKFSAEKLNKIEHPILTTTDGDYVYSELQNIVVVSEDSILGDMSCEAYKNLQGCNLKCFLTEASAIKYLHENNKKYSLKDIELAFNKFFENKKVYTFSDMFEYLEGDIEGCSIL